VLNVIEADPSCGLYLMGGPRTLKLSDSVKCEKWSGGLQLIDGKMKHRFNKVGDYIGSTFSSK
jgi:hypothetical protein